MGTGWPNLLATILAVAIAGVAAPPQALSAALPDRAPRPEASPHAGRPPASLPKLERGAPLPAPRPKDEPPLPAGTPAPEPKPVIAPRPSPPAPARTACLSGLRKLGAIFSERPPIAEPAGCAILDPLAVTRLSRSVGISPEAVMNCDAAAHLARFVTEIASPAAERLLGSPIASIGQASAYVCRDRHSGGKMSEHAFGNAIDISRFVLKNGTVVDVEDKAGGTPEAAFLAEIRKAACGPFRTVLGPGADADHALHLHLDLQPRQSRNAFCQ